MEKNSKQLKPARLIDFLPGKTSRDQSPLLIGVLAGTGIGREVVGAALQVLKAVEAVTKLRFEVHQGGLIGDDANKEHGQWLPEDTVEFCADVFERGGAILNGPGGGRYVYDLRRRFDLFCKFVPVRPPQS